MEKKVEKNFKCEICEKSFSTTQNHKQHVNCVHGKDKRFICNVCNKTFGSQKELTEHVKSIHQEIHKICPIRLAQDI